MYRLPDSYSGNYYTFLPVVQQPKNSLIEDPFPLQNQTLPSQPLDHPTGHDRFRKISHVHWERYCDLHLADEYYFDKAFLIAPEAELKDMKCLSIINTTCMLGEYSMVIAERLE